MKGAPTPARVVRSAAAAYVAVVLLLSWWPSHPEKAVARDVVGRVRENGRATRDLGFALVDLVGNVALYVPLGVLLALALGRRWGLAVVGGATLSLLTEIVQAELLPGRVGSAVDVATNSAGAAIGVLICRWSRALADRREPSFNDPRT